MRNLVLIDIDGVLITTPSWKADTIHEDGYSDFNKICVMNFNQIIDSMECELWLSSSRRFNKELSEFNNIFKNRGIVKELKGLLPFSNVQTSRLDEINSFLNENDFSNILIIDDDNSLQDLMDERKKFWIKTEPLIGLDKNKLCEAINLIKNWC